MKQRMPLHNYVTFLCSTRGSSRSRRLQKQVAKRHFESRYYHWSHSQNLEVQYCQRQNCRKISCPVLCLAAKPTWYYLIKWRKFLFHRPIDCDSMSSRLKMWPLADIFQRSMPGFNNAAYSVDLLRYSYRRYRSREISLVFKESSVVLSEFSTGLRRWTIGFMNISSQLRSASYVDLRCYTVFTNQ